MGCHSCVCLRDPHAPAMTLVLQTQVSEIFISSRQSKISAYASQGALLPAVARYSGVPISSSSNAFSIITIYHRGTEFFLVQYCDPVAAGHNPDPNCSYG